DGALKRLR
ncbi:hypothetical protein D018_2678B, partial [Vibrio parahaemolyticus VP2007-007]